jgi:hypothetical protein
MESNQNDSGPPQEQEQQRGQAEQRQQQIETTESNQFESSSSNNGLSTESTNSESTPSASTSPSPSSEPQSSQTAHPQPQPQSQPLLQQPSQQQTIVHVRDRLFHALFYRIAIMYARKFPKTFRRFIEFFMLLLALGSFGLLSYLHVVFNRNPINCLAFVQDKWPREGILRVEIVHNASTYYIMSNELVNAESIPYSLRQSYEKEYSNSMLELFANYLNTDEVVQSIGDMSSTTMTSSSTVNQQSIKQSTVVTPPTLASDQPESDIVSVTNPNDVSSSTQMNETNSSIESGVQDSFSVLASPSQESSSFLNQQTRNKSNDSNFYSIDEAITSSNLSYINANESASLHESLNFINDTSKMSNSTNASANMSIDIETTSPTTSAPSTSAPKKDSTRLPIETISPAYRLLREAFAELQLFSKVFEDNYIIEYSLEYGFLRLSPQTRQKLNITVMLVTLDPQRDACFGSGFNKFVLDEFLGYNEILMLSIKNIAEKEKNKGFVRNAVTGEHFRFVSSWMARSSYVAALLVMILFVSDFRS